VAIYVASRLFLITKFIIQFIPVESTEDEGIDDFIGLVYFFILEWVHPETVASDIELGRIHSFLGVPSGVNKRVPIFRPRTQSQKVLIFLS
jgi:hypothetical protein